MAPGPQENSPVDGRMKDERSVRCAADEPLNARLKRFGQRQRGLVRLLVHGRFACLGQLSQLMSVTLCDEQTTPGHCCVLMHHVMHAVCAVRIVETMHCLVDASPVFFQMHSRRARRAPASCVSDSVHDRPQTKRFCCFYGRPASEASSVKAQASFRVSNVKTSPSLT